MKIFKYLRCILALGIIIFSTILVFNLGRKFGFDEYRKSCKDTLSVQYCPAEEIKDTIYFPTPARDTLYLLSNKDVLPSDAAVQLPKHHNINIKNPTFKDSTILDYYRFRSYDQVLFSNDSLGRMSVKLGVTQNKLLNLSYEYLPKYKIITNTVTKTQYIETPKVHQFIGAGISSNNQIKAYYGITFKSRFGININYINDLKLKSNAVGVDVNYMLH